MEYDHVNLGSAHETYHHVTRCLHSEDLYKSIAGGAKFSQIVAADRLQQEEQTLEGLAADLKDPSGLTRSGLAIGRGSSSDGDQRGNAVLSVVREDAASESNAVRTSSVRAEDAASIACFGLEHTRDMRPEGRKEEYIRVNSSSKLQSGSSFLRRKREEIRTRIAGNGRKALKRIRALFAREVKEREKPVQNRTELRAQQEYLLDSYGRDGAYKQMPESGLLKSNISEKA